MSYKLFIQLKQSIKESILKVYVTGEKTYQSAVIETNHVSIFPLIVTL